MMYYIHDGTAQLGPFTIEQLKEKSISRNTSIWREGLNDWVEASTLEELADAFVHLPPQFKQKVQSRGGTTNVRSTSEKLGFAIGRKISIVGLCIVVFGIGYFSYNKSHKSIVDTISDIPYVDPEHSSPERFIVANGTYHPNFWQTKEVIDGTLTNRASHTNYKDVHIKVSFYSQTNSEISTKEYVLYDYVPYGSTKNFTLKIDKPDAAASCGWTAVGATYY